MINNTDKIVYNTSRISDKRIVIKFDEYDEARCFLSYINVERVENFINSYEYPCIKILENVTQYMYCYESYYKDEKYDIIDYKYLYNGDFYVIGDKILLMYE